MTARRRVLTYLLESDGNADPIKEFHEDEDEIAIKMHLLFDGGIIYCTLKAIFLARHSPIVVVFGC